MIERDELAALFRRAADHATAYRQTTAQAPRTPVAPYAQVLAAAAAVTPEQGMPAADVLDDLVRLATPGLRAMAGPRFFGWVIGGSHPMGVAADWLTSAWGQNAGNHVASPAAAAIETVAAQWLLDMLHLPAEASVGFVTGATMANFVCLAAARGEVLRRVGWSIEERGLFGAPPIRVLIGEEAHTTVFSALHYLGFGKANAVRVAVDGQGAMRADAFADALAAGDGPAIVITQAGQINTGAFDPHAAILPLARAAGAWVHVDGAFGLWARACPDLAAQAGGIELADSWATDGHKWLQTPYDCGYAIVRDGEAHRRAMTIAASYLPPVSEGERDPSHFVPELSRRARGFATWAMLRHLGRTGIAEMVARHCRLARQLAQRLAAEPGVTLLNEVVLNQVLVRFGPEGETGDTQTRATIAAIQADGTCFAGGTMWQGQWALRLSVIGAATEDEDVERSAEAILGCWRGVRDR